MTSPTSRFLSPRTSSPPDSQAVADEPPPSGSKTRPTAVGAGVRAGAADPQGPRVDAQRDRTRGDDAESGRHRPRGAVTLDDVARAVRRSGHSHFPVYEDDLDHLLGVLFVKDLFHPGPIGIEAIRAVGRERRQRLAGPRRRKEGARALHRPGVAACARAPRRDAPARRAFAVVVDEYGGVAGVLTVNDLVSELVGDLRDEFDRSRCPRSSGSTVAFPGRRLLRRRRGPRRDRDRRSRRGLCDARRVPSRRIRADPRGGRRARVRRVDATDHADGPPAGRQGRGQAPAATMTTAVPATGSGRREVAQLGSAQRSGR